MAENLESSEALSPENSLTSESNTNLSEVHLNQLAEYEELFKNRYSENDDEFVKAVENPDLSPPVVHPFFARTANKRSWDRSDNRDSKRGRYDQGERRSSNYNHKDRIWSRDRRSDHWQNAKSQGPNHNPQYQENHRSAYSNYRRGDRRSYQSSYQGNEKYHHS